MAVRARKPTLTQADVGDSSFRAAQDRKTPFAGVEIQESAFLP